MPPFLFSDIVIWNGIVGEYGSFYPFIETGDNVLLAGKDDYLQYKAINPSKKPN